MGRDLSRTAVIGVGVVGIVAGLLVVVQLPAANQYEETTISAAGVGLLLVLFGVKTLAETEW
ncbi:hypothetical protein [Halobacterium bonnevillei]|uniref:Uncharacterized protein n=1 Tax=Halobacterium bonnevillei TaxID=2692200 RepID=A0A6B0SJV1_9EURY|nr:hypothetical protein [Halobacterium bonnevillei]MXR19162.1 hypothetical protein [Halobacterium bonnevillei]